MSMDILIVEDDHALNEGIQLTLRQEGYRFYPAHSLKEPRELWNQQAYQLFIYTC
jgi:DNA-binding response OmpR family regulator